MIQNAYDLTIIGSGPVGMYAAFYGSLRKLKVKLIESLPELGGQLQALYPEKYIYDVPGFSEIKAGDLIKSLKEQMNTVKENIDIIVDERVDYVRRRDEDNILEICTEKNCHYTKTVLITAGKGAFQPRTLELPNESNYTNIHYFVNDMKKFANKRVAIFGGGDSAVDWANMLNDVAKEVSIIHRRDDFRAHEHSVEMMKHSKVNVLTSYVLDKVEGEDKINKLYLKSVKQEENKEFIVDEIIVLFGFLSSLGPIETWDLTLENKALLVDNNKQTNIKGVYAAGDSSTYEGKVKMITCGFGEAVIAVNSIYGYLFPDKKNAPVFSSALKNK
ncbi:MAG: ferredoxin--NADP(+) reductase [Haloplasmataceae bacterium]|jgi:thioredoxin reductase (NADPH)|nr:ferredoxin--NADP(+) reductase [Haloplasmataceae bacterium]